MVGPAGEVLVPYAVVMPGAMRDKLDVVVLGLSALIAVISAVSMRDHVRLVEIVGLFGSGMGTGAGIAAMVARRRHRAERDAA